MLLKLSHDHNICGVGVARHSEDTTEIFSDAGESQTVSSSHSVSRLDAHPSNATLCSPTP